MKQSWQSVQPKQFKQLKQPEQTKQLYEKPEIEIIRFEIEDITCDLSGLGASWGELPDL